MRIDWFTVFFVFVIICSVSLMGTAFASIFFIDSGEAYQNTLMEYPDAKVRRVPERCRHFIVKRKK